MNNRKKLRDFMLVNIRIAESHHLFFARLAARLESNAQLRPIKRAGKYLLIIFFGNTILIIIFLLSLIAFLYRTATAN